MATNFERDVRWFNTQGVVENEIVFPSPSVGQLGVATSGIVNVKHGNLQSRSEIDAGSGDSAVGLLMKGPIEGNTMYTVSHSASVSTGWVGVGTVSSAGELVYVEPTLISRGQGGLIHVCIRKETVPVTNEIICFFFMASAGSNVALTMQVQRLAAKPDGYISAVC